MLNMAKQKKKTEAKKSVVPGVYTSKVTSVYWSKGYVEGTSFDVEYELVDMNGKVHSFKERFHNNETNRRTQDFYDKLDSYGIEDLADFVGVEETVEILKDASSSYSKPQIVNRELYTAEKGGE